jgi:hypothetical protein
MMDFTTPPQKKKEEHIFSMTEELQILKFLWFRSDTYLPVGGLKRVQEWLDTQKQDTLAP